MTRTPTLIGIIGRKRSGKDAFAATLVDELGFTRVAFADPLRAAAHRLDPIVGPCSLPGDPAPRHRRLTEVIAAIGWESAKDCVPEVRRTLQALGTDAIRTLDDGFWVRQAMAVVDELRLPVKRWPMGDPVRAGRDIVITDVRFPNEAEAIAERGGRLIRIVRPGFVSADAHPTETALDDFLEDELVVNDEGLEELAALARYSATL